MGICCRHQWGSVVQSSPPLTKAALAKRARGRRAKRCCRRSRSGASQVLFTHTWRRSISRSTGKVVLSR